MTTCFLGMTHLGRTLKTATEIRGLETTTDPEKCDLMFVTVDVDDHSMLGQIDRYMEAAVAIPEYIPVVLVSQVPPGYTRRWAKRRNLYYQVDTIIMNRAIERAVMPERIIIGSRLGMASLPLPHHYAQWCAAFNCPVIRMDYESAELCKLAINYYLARQVETTNELAKVAMHIGACWDSVIPGLTSDKRIGAYVVPGSVGGHLPRDVLTIEKLLSACSYKEQKAEINLGFALTAKATHVNITKELAGYEYSLAGL